MNRLLLVFVFGAVLKYGQTGGGKGGGKKGSGGKGSGCKGGTGTDEIWATQKYKYCSYDRVLSNLFYTEEQILNKAPLQRQVATIKSEIKWNSTKDPNNLPDRQLQHYLNRKVHHQRAASYCCETTWSCVSPLSVQYGGKEYNVYQPEDGYQLVFQGHCGAGETCQSGICTEEDDYYTWIIIVVDDLDYDPPILFAPIKFNNFCYCATT